MSTALEAVITQVLKDPNEGVRARAAFVSGILGLPSAVPVLTEMTQQDESLGEVALLALEFPRKRLFMSFQKGKYFITKEVLYIKIRFSVSISYL